MTFRTTNKAIFVALTFAAAVTRVEAFSASSAAGAKIDLPSGFDVEAVGGWSEVEQLAADPKGELVSLIVSGMKGSGGDTEFLSSEKLEALAALLPRCGKGFDAELVDGEWVSVLNRQGKKSPRFQKFVNKRNKVQKAFANFDVDSMTFLNLAYTPHQRGQLKALVEYNPVADNFDTTSDGKIVLRRISCDITDVNFKYWKLPKVTLPLKKSGGYLDFLYLDEDIRVTVGNRGGLFVHFRPEFLDKALSE